MMTRTPFVFVLLFSCLCLAADERDFRPLFNGRDLSGWRHHGAVKKNNAWEVEVPTGVLHNNLGPGRSGTNFVTEGKFWNFTVRFDFKVPPGSNSGIFLRGRHEIQLAGDYAERKVGPAGNGAIWNVKAPSVYASKASGEWQTMEATMVGHQITVFLNGTKIHDKVLCDKPTGGALDARVNEPGPIMLQGTIGPIRFRNLRIKELSR